MDMKDLLKHFFTCSIVLMSMRMLAHEVPAVTGKLQSTTAAPVIIDSASAEVEISTPGVSGAADYRIRNIISLKVDQASDTFLTAATTVRTWLTVYRWDKTNTLITPTRNESLVVSVNNRYNRQTIDLSSLKLADGYKVKVVIDSITVNGFSVDTLPKYVYVESEIRMDRYYDFSSVIADPVTGILLTPVNTDCDTTTDELQIMWGTVPEAEEYQVEWTYVNNYGIDSSTFIDSTQLSADFKHNSTRITTTANFYNIGLTYEKGYIAVRIRPIGRDYLNPDTYMYGVWSEADSASMASVGSSARYRIRVAHENNKNWQYSSTYAEEGKKKEVISYFDGSLHNRQSVTKVNSDKNVIVGETMYDYQGRPAVNVLPTPVSFPNCSTSTEEPAIKYYPRYNVNFDSAAYSKKDFDIDSVGVCNPFAPGMDTISGSSQYYSSNNPDKSFQQAFVPDAELYPFSQVEYTPDNTGRIRSQSGVGKTFRLGSGHETKYYYSQPNQLQLDRLFGSEAGDASHYKKNTVRDANGQISVSYMNQEGKTVATALAGDAPKDSAGTAFMEALGSAANAADTLTVDLFKKNSSGISTVNKANALHDAIEFSTQITVAYSSNYKFSYGLTVDSLSDSCLVDGMCMSCIYDLEIKISDECGNDLTSLGTYNDSAIHRLIGHLDSIPNGFTMNCTGSGISEADSISLDLDPGTYTVSKVLSLNKDARDFYVKSYLDTTYNSCIRTLGDFLAQEIAALDTTSCYVSCSACAAALGTRDEFVASGKGSELQYDMLYEQCMEPCKPTSLCESSFQMMLIDVSPGGQYGKFDAATVTSTDNLSVLNGSNMLAPNLWNGGTSNWKHPRLKLNGSEYAIYMDDEGNRTRVPVFLNDDSVTYTPAVDAVSKVYTDENGDKYTFPENLNRLQDFIPVWQSYFARSLVVYHPEYVYYMACSDHEKIFPGDTMSSEHFDSLLISTETFAEAVSRGFIKPTYASTSVSPDDKLTDLLTQSSSHLYDPFFTNSSYSISFNKPGGGYMSYAQSAMKNLMGFNSALYAIINSVGYSMLEIAATDARCGGNYTGVPTGTCLAFGTDMFTSLTPNYVFKNDSVRDREWGLLKSFYLSEKRKIQFLRMDFYARYYNWSMNDWYGGCNACMTSSYFMAGSGMTAPTLHPFTPASPAYNKKQPCSIYTYGLYAHSQKRFTTPEGMGLTASNVNVPYMVYQATGQCPMAFLVQNFLSSMAQDSLLQSASLVSLNTIPAFGPDMYTLLNGGTTPSVPVNYQWDFISVSSNVLTAVIKDPLTGAYADTMTLNIGGTPISNFGQVVGIQNLTYDHVTAGRYYFDAAAVYVSGGITFTSNITGSTRMNIKDCNFEPQCTANQFAVDLSNLMSILLVEGKWQTTTAYNISRDTLTAPFVSATIKNMLGTPNSTLMWKYTSGPKTYELYDSTNSGTKLRMTRLSITPAITAGQFVALSNMRSNYNNLFRVDILDSTGVKVAVMEGKMELVTGTGSTGISMGDCGFADAPECSTTEHQVRKDLEKLIGEFLVQDTLSGNVNLFTQVNFSWLLKGYLPSTVTSTSSTYLYDTTALNNYDTLRFDTDGACSFEIYHSVHDTNAVALNFADLIAVTDLTGVPPMDEQGNFHDFYFIGTYDSAGTVMSDTVHGTSCWPIKNCNHCDSTMVTPPPMDSSVVSIPDIYDGWSSTGTLVGIDTTACDSAYNVLLTALVNYNSSVYAAEHSDTLDVNIYPTLSQYIKGGYCNCNYVDTLLYYIALPTGSTRPKPGDIDHFPGCTHSVPLGSDNACKALYGKYATTNRSYNAYLQAHPSLHYPALDTSITSVDFAARYCNCGAKYIATLTAIMNGYNPDSATAYAITRMDNNCATAPCVPAAPDTALVFPAATYSPNPCVQQMLNIAALNAQNDYQQYKDSMTTQIASLYTEHCMAALENFTYTYTDKEYHFTLYYYDQAGNLVKTIPPEGVELLDIDATADALEQQIISDRELGRQTVFTNHRMATNYEYNSLNQLVYQDMPDHDKLSLIDFALPNGLDSRLKITRTQFVNANRGYTSGFIDLGGGNTRSIMYMSTNGGNNWTKMNNTVAADLNDVFFVDSSTAFAVGSKGVILKTSDGGANWDAKNLYGTYPQDLYAVCFSSASNGVVAGVKSASYAGIYYTSNGGTTYTAATTSSLAAGDTITGMVYDGSKYYITTKNAGRGGIYYSTTGSSWTAVTAKRAGDLAKVHFMNGASPAAVAVGEDGTFLRSPSVSSIGFYVVTTGISKPFRDVYFKDINYGVAIIDSSANKGQIWKTEDAGNHWELLSRPGDYYTSLQEYEYGKALASGENGLLAKVILTVSPFGIIKLQKPSHVNDLQYTDGVLYGASPQLVAVGNNDTIYYTQNGSTGGTTWTKVKTTSLGVSGGDGSFKKVLVKDSSGTQLKGVLLTQNGKLYSMYKDAADVFSFSLSAVKDLSGSTISSYFFSDITMNTHSSTQFYAFDTISKRAFRGTVTGSAATFAYMDTTTAQQKDIVSIAVDSTAGYLVLAGTKGALKYKSNPASTTTGYVNRRYTVLPASLNDIAVKTSNELYAVGIDGAVWNTNNGTEWRMLSSGNAVSLNAIAMDNNGAYGAITGDGGKLYVQSVTDSLHISLTETYLGTTENLNELVLSDSNAYIGTADGQLIHVPDITSAAYSNVTVRAMTGAFHALAMRASSLPVVFAGGDGSAMYQCLNSNSARVNELFLSSLLGISFADANNGYILSSRNDIRHTTDGGATWSIIVPSSPATVMQNIYSPKPEQAILLGAAKYFAVINGTAAPAAVTVSTGPSVALVCIDFNQSGYGIIGGAQRAIFSVVPSGSTYTVTHLVTAPAPTSGNYNFGAVKVFPGNGYLISGTQARIYYGVGASLTDQMSYTGLFTSLTTRGLGDMFFLDDRTGYIVGTGGVALKCSLSANIEDGIGTTTGGIAWDTLHLSDPFGIFNSGTKTTIDLRTIDFIDRHHAFIGGLYNSFPANPKYAMLIDDNSNYYSTRFFYDKLGRMVLSQNSKQYNKVPKTFSYTTYDELGRIQEVGEKSENSSGTLFREIFGSYVNGSFNVNTINDDSLSSWLAGSGARKEVTRTYYDTVSFTGMPMTQDNLRKRVSDVTYEDVYDGVDSTYQHGTHYTYDIHGNVNTLVQDNPELIPSSQRYKRIDYEYDLISGKVNKVIYQPDAPDLFIHQYSYDADNRITKVETSTDDIIYQTDAKYFYYAHGPLARVEYGKNQVQGMDYAYTLQGWIKGVNSNTLKSSRDMGQDGLNDTSNVNQYFAEDAMGYTLNYYAGDYKAIDRLKWSSVTNRFEAQTAGSSEMGYTHDLYNGNISLMGTTIIARDTTVAGLISPQVPKALLSPYKYDQLNRLTESRGVDNIDLANNLWQSSGSNKKYRNIFTYDANGNILTQSRMDDNENPFDMLEYQYSRDVSGKLLQNRLYHVNDSGNPGDQPDDLEDQGSFDPTLSTMNSVNNYRYDEIGNLVHDGIEEIDTIKWTVYGKIKEIKRTSGSSKKNLKFDYDAGGNRIAKHVLSSAGSWERSTYYVRDVQGNVMSTYDQTGADSSLSFKLLEQHLYGSSRLGMVSPNKEMIGADTTDEFAYDTLNKRQYELSNHLGNVLNVAYDRKIALDTNSDGTVDYYVADLASASDYSPFGAPLSGRGFTSSSYRYGFNGKEKDDEVKGDGAQYDYGFRVYDARLGKFLSVDPLSNKFAYYTPYQFAGNKPIVYIDLDGLEDVTFYEKEGKQYMKIAYNKEDTKKLIANDPNDPVKLRIHYKDGISSQFKGPNAANEKRVFQVHSKPLINSILVADISNKDRKTKNEKFYSYTIGGSKDDLLVPPLEKKKEQEKAVEPEAEQEKPEMIKYIILDIEVDKELQKEFIYAPDLKDYFKAVRANYQKQGYDEVIIRKMVPVDKVIEDGGNKYSGDIGNEPRLQCRPVVVETGEKPKT
ncbi:MAG: repeat-associated core domain protein [Bacteroidetes bacterium]|nr:repeat-associated core domain protein [Bacteroidota bacterium]